MGGFGRPRSEGTAFLETIMVYASCGLHIYARVIWPFHIDSLRYVDI